MAMHPQRQDDDDVALRALLGQRIRDARLRFGFSLEDLASTARTSKTLVSQVENGHQQPGAFVLTRILGALGLDIVDVLGEYYLTYKMRGEGVLTLFQPERAGKLLGQRPSPAATEMASASGDRSSRRSKRVASSGSSEEKDAADRSLAAQVKKRPATKKRASNRW